MKKKRLTRLIALAACLAAVYHWWMGSPFFSTHLYTSVSPDKRFLLDVYSEKRWRIFTMPGDGGNRYIHAILRNRWGWKTGETSRACAPSDRDAYGPGGIRWDLAGGYVWFAPARGINLRSGDCEM